MKFQKHNRNQSSIKFGVEKTSSFKKKDEKSKDDIKAKKHLGQHFLTDLSIAQQITNGLTLFGGYKYVIEIGPGMGILTQFLIENNHFELFPIDIDFDSITYLKKRFPSHTKNFIYGDFLNMDMDLVTNKNTYAVIGNFPYNISTQILFKVLDNKDQIPEVVGMFQKEVAERIAAPPGSKVYGITSVLLQAYYDIEYLFTVNENVFNPPPKVKSGVIRLNRNSVKKLDCNEGFFKTVVKTAFNQRRKTLRNSLRPLLSETTITNEIFNLRPEQLSVQQFISITNLLEPIKN